MDNTNEAERLIKQYQGLIPVEGPKGKKALPLNPEGVKRLQELGVNIELPGSRSSLYTIIAFDTTGSMSDCIEAVRKNVGEITRELLEKEKDIYIMVAGVGEYGDAPDTLQIRNFTRETQELRNNISSIRDTAGGGPCQVSLELLFQELNNKYVKEGNKYALVVFTDEIAHGQDDAEPNPRADYKKELAMLRRSLAGFYIVSCTGNGYTIDLQKQLLNPESENEKHVLLEDIIKDSSYIPSLIVALVKRTHSKGTELMYLEDLRRRDPRLAERVMKALPPA